MKEDDDHSVVINLPSQRVVAKKSVDMQKTSVFSIQHHLSKNSEKIVRKPSINSLKKYSISTCDTPVPVKTFKRDELLLPYKMYAKNQERIKHKRRLSINIYEKYKIMSTDLRNRLHVDKPADDVEAIADIDTKYYTCVNGRPLELGIPVFKSLKHILNNQLRMNQELGYRKDCILNIDTNFRNEIAKYNKSVQDFNEQYKYFDAFISDDYRKSMKCLDQSEKLKLRVVAKQMELENLANEEFTITARLMGLNYMYGVQQKYGRFLYYLSPPSWRAKNREFARSVEIEAMGFDLGSTSEEDTFNVIFGKMQRERLGKLVKPVLYFTNPQDLMEIFCGIELQQSRYFAHVTQMSPYAKNLRNNMKILQNLIAQDTAGIVNAIKRFETLLVFCEESSLQMENRFFKVLNGLFYDSVGATDVLKMFVHLEFCYEKVFTEKPINLDIFTMAKSLENFYMEYTKKIEEQHTDKIKQAVAQYVKSQRNKYRRAKLASRELRLFDRLERALLRAHEPPEKHIYLPPIERKPMRMVSRARVSKPVVCVEKKRPTLTEAEMEYLTLFTNWTEGEDPANYLQCLKLSGEEKEALNLMK